MSRAAQIAMTVLFTLIAGCTAGQRGASGPQEPGDAASPAPTIDVALASALQPFDACEDLLSYFIDNAVELVGPYGLDGGVGFDRLDAVAGQAMEEAAEADDGGARSAVPAPVEGEDFSGTNIQEAGVDEPDFVKTDGRRIVAIARGRLRVVDVTGDEPRQLGAMQLPGGWGHELLMDGDRALVLAAADRTFHPQPLADDAIGIVPGPFSTPTSVLTLVDLSDPSSPRVEATLTLDGGYVSARMVDGVARVVMRSQPTGLAFVHPEGGGLRAEQEATERNREIVRSSTADNWVPYYILEDHRGGRKQTTEGRLLDCDRVHRQDEFAGLGLLSVLSMDLGGPLSPEGGVAVVGQGETVYASAESLYVALTKWGWEEELVRPRAESTTVTTQIHKFDIAAPLTARYRASGRLPGHLLSQWSMSEHEGILRVATTEGDPWGGGAEQSESAVTALEERDASLVAVGRVEGLGKGEQIYAVRMMGDVGYVVTFRQVDPLYTIDLSNSRDLEVVGELKILGYSAYLHPVGEGLLLGVGQDATEEGQTRGSQLSLFDVSDPAAPARLQQIAVMDPSERSHSSSEVEYDHRAFLHWAPTGLTVVPVSYYAWDEETGKDDSFVGAIGFAVQGREPIGRIGELTHTGEGMDPWMGQIRRSIVIGDRLFTVSELGMRSSDLTTLDSQAWLGW